MSFELSCFPNLSLVRQLRNEKTGQVLVGLTDRGFRTIRVGILSDVIKNLCF